MKIAVIIPTYNRAGVVGRAIETALAQTLPPEEIIVVDDGSSDGTREVVEAYGPPVRYIHQQNQGLAASRNTGVRACRSPWVAFIDDDDEWAPGKLEKQAKAIAATPDAVLCYTGLVCVVKGGGSTVIMPNSPDRIYPTIRLRTPFSPCSVMIRKDALEAVGGFNPRLRAAEDWELFMRLVPTGRLAWVPEPLLIVHASPETMSMQSESMLAAELSIMDAMLTGLDGVSRRIWRRRILGRIYYSAAVSARARGKNCWGHLMRSFLYWPSPLFLPRRFKTLAAAAAAGLRGNGPKQGLTSPAGTTEDAR